MTPRSFYLTIMQSMRLMVWIRLESFNILSENEPLAKTNILFYLEKLYPNISSTQLNKCCVMIGFFGGNKFIKFVLSIFIEEHVID